MNGWLVVNQDIQASDRTRRSLNSRGLSCETAHDWRTAEQRLHSHHYDVIVVDSQTETGDSRDIFDHVSSDPSCADSKIVVIADEPPVTDDRLAFEAAFVRGEQEMLADIDSLIQKLR